MFTSSDIHARTRLGNLQRLCWAYAVQASRVWCEQMSGGRSSKTCFSKFCNLYWNIHIIPYTPYSFATKWFPLQQLMVYPALYIWIRYRHWSDIPKLTLTSFFQLPFQAEMPKVKLWPRCWPQQSFVLTNHRSCVTRTCQNVEGREGGRNTWKERESEGEMTGNIYGNDLSK